VLNAGCQLREDVEWAIMLAYIASVSASNARVRRAFMLDITDIIAAFAAHQVSVQALSSMAVEAEMYT